MKIGPINFAVPFCQAGLAGYSDRAMRTVARRRGCPYAVTEALLDIILVNGGEGLRKSIDISDEDHPVAGQIMGSEPENMAIAAQLMQRAGYDVIDLNFACPVKKIKNKARGGHMLKDVPRAVAILRAVRDAIPSEVPITVSTRRGFDDSPESVDRFYEIMEAAWELGVAAVRVHARTVEQKYLGQSRWPFLAELKQRYPDRMILGSGDLFTAEDVVRMLQETKVDCAWIARGAIGNPWIFQHAKILLDHAEQGKTEPSGSAAGHVKVVDATDQQDRGQSHSAPFVKEPLILAPPTITEQREALEEHFAIAMQIHGEQLAGRRMRKMGIKYSRFHPESDTVKRDFISVFSLRDWSAVLNRWYASGGPGVWPDANAADEVNNAPDVQSCGVG